MNEDNSRHSMTLNISMKGGKKVLKTAKKNKKKESERK
jgi:hypothetical protein